MTPIQRQILEDMKRGRTLYRLKGHRPMIQDYGAPLNTDGQAIYLGTFQALEDHALISPFGNLSAWDASIVVYGITPAALALLAQ